MNDNGTPQKFEYTGAEELRRIVGCLSACRESALDPFTAEQLVKIVRACWLTGYDVYPDDLTLAERKYAAKHGKVSNACVVRLKKEMG